MNNCSNRLIGFLLIVPVFSFVLLYISPTVFVAIAIALLQCLVALRVGYILISEKYDFNHFQGLCLGLTAVLCITVGFGSLYSHLLLHSFPTKEHFRFTDDTFSSVVMDRKYSRMYLLLSEHLISNGLSRIEECAVQLEQESDSECGRRKNHTKPPEWDKDDEENILKELMYVHLKHQEADLYALEDIIELAKDGRPQLSKLDDTYRDIANHWRKTISVGLNYRHGRNARDAVGLVLLPENVYPEKLDTLVIRALKCHYGVRTDETQACEMGEEKIPPGAFGLARHHFAKQNLEYLNSMDLLKENREIVFNSLMFSALSLMTSGHSDMAPKSNLARLYLFGEFLAFVAFLLLILPIGLKQKSS